MMKMMTLAGGALALTLTAALPASAQVSTYKICVMLKELAEGAAVMRDEGVSRTTAEELVAEITRSAFGRGYGTVELLRAFDGIVGTTYNELSWASPELAGSITYDICMAQGD